MRVLWVTLLVAVAACSSGGGDRDTFCERLGQTHDLDVELQEVERGDQAAVREALAQYVDSLEELSSSAPGSIRPDAEVILDYARALAETATTRTDPILDANALAEVASQFAGIEAATARLDAYGRNECEIDLG